MVHAHTGKPAGKPVKRARKSVSDTLLRDFHTDLSVGDILHRARVRLEISLDQAAAETRIRPSYLRAIEEGHLEQLPGRIYAVGFIRTYAEFLNLDGDKIVELLKRQSGEKVEPRPLGSTLPVDQDHSNPRFKTLLIVAVCLVIGLALYGGAFKAASKERNIPSVPADLKEQVTLLNRPQTAPDPVSQAVSLTDMTMAALAKAVDTVADPAAVGAPAVHPVILKAVENVWLEIRTADRRVILSRVLSKGEEYWVPEDQAGLIMTLGNAGGLQIMLDGAPLPLLGQTGQVIRRMPLDPAYLKQFLKKSGG